jgi:crotonobetainyl-CoA:carnitine CoA-transferase CaiB-like acyl-CoA transferase
MRQQALEDVDVLDVGQIYNGPYCSLLLSYLGANVVKVEPPFGEPLRTRVDEGEPEELIMLNSCKEGITLNLKTDRGKELFKELAAKADVVVENFSVGTMEKLGLGYDVLSDLNPKLVYAHGSGFGESGPKSEELAMDLIVQAVGGIADVTGFPDGDPVKTGVAAAAFAGGTHLAAGPLAALYHRERTGEGQYVEVSLHDAIFPTLISQLAVRYRNPDIPSRTGNRHGGLAKSPYNIYEASDGYVAILCASDQHWETLLELIGREDLRGDPRFATNTRRVENVDEVDAVIEDWTTDRKKYRIEEMLTSVGLPCGAVRTVDEVINDPHLEYRDMVNEIDHPTYGEIKVPGSPIRLSKSDPPDVDPAPTKGEDNARVLRDRLGLSEETIEALEADGII